MELSAFSYILCSTWK